MIPDPIKKFVDVFSRLPSIGPRQATRLAFHLLELGKNEIRDLSLAVNNLQELGHCPACFFVHSGQQELCLICSNRQRKKETIMVVEKETDLISLERAKRFFGHYFIIGDLKKCGGLEADQKLKIKSLQNRIKKELGGSAEEIILAINPTTYGDLNSAFLAQELKGFAKKITRLGRGIPTGGEIEFADEETLGGAFDNRS